MELQFNKNILPCLQRVTWEVQSLEQTQEVRLPDGMPDIGSVLGAWGQVLMRGKEWRGGGMNMTGGVMVWVLYAPEDGSSPQCVEAWIPFTAKWDFPDTERDGSILTSCLLRGVDARSISARKLMVRTGIGVLGQAYIPGEAAIYAPTDLPVDVQVLRRSYPMELPREAGEKPFALEEELTLPGSCPKLDKLIRYDLQPELIDRKVVAGKVVFRGAALLHILYCGQDGQLYSWDFEIPFSQYTELEREYDQDARAILYPAVTSLELETGEEDKLRLKAGLTCQYLIFDRPMIEIVEDAYSTGRPVMPRVEELRLPAVLDTASQTIRAEQTVDAEGVRMADMAFYPDQPRQQRQADGVELAYPGQFQMLYYDAAGSLKSGSARWEGTWSLPAADDSRVEATAWPSGRPQASLGGGSANLRGDVLAQAVTVQQQGLPMVTALELGEMTEPDPARPSLILRRPEGCSLWDVAKRHGSTVAAIQKANDLQAEPTDDRILLIPVM